MPDAREVILPYSKESFSIPQNVYIIGTMNTADRSIDRLDTALRRRFHFVEEMPDSSVLSDINVDGLNVARLLDTINRRIAYLYDRDHMIGHAFFTPLLEDKTLGTLSKIFRNTVIPLLQDYFADDYEKISLILGDNAKSQKQYQFLVAEQADPNVLFKGTPESIYDLKEELYYINEEAFSHIESYAEIL